LQVDFFGAYRKNFLDRSAFFCYYSQSNRQEKTAKAKHFVKTLVIIAMGNAFSACGNFMTLQTAKVSHGLKKVFSRMTALSTQSETLSVETKFDCFFP
jgi:hypothetical protein